MPLRICALGRATSRRASSRFGRLPTERSRRIRTSSTSSGAACPTPRCRPGPTFADQEVSDLAYFITTFSPDFSNPEKVPKPVPLPSAPKATKESIELGKKLYEDNGCVKCHGTLGRGDGPSAPTLVDDWGHPIRPADLSQSWTLRGGSSREDIFRTMSTGLNGTPMPSFLDALTPEQRWAITDYIVSLSGSNGPGYSNLVVAKHVQDPIDLAKGAASFASARCGPLSDRRADHGARTLVPSARDERHRSGDLRCGLHRPPRSMARHERGENREERAVASRATGGGGGAAAGAPPARGGAAAGQGTSLATRKSRRPGAGQPPAPAAAGSVCRTGSGASRPAIRVLRRRRDPDSFAGADGRPQALLHFRRRPELGGSLVLRSGPPRSASVHRQGKRGHRSQRHGRCHWCRELRPGRMVGHLQAAASRQPRAPRSRRESSCRSPSRSGTGSRASVATGEVSRSGTPSTSSRKWSHRPSARW